PAVLCLLHVLQDQERLWRWGTGLAVLLALEGLVYPIIWLGLIIIIAAAGTASLLNGNWRRPLLLGLVALISSASVYPYPHSLTQAKPPEAALGLSTHPGAIFRNALTVGLGLSPLWVLLALGRRQWWERLRRRSCLQLFVALSVLFAFATWMFLYVPDNAGYKI